MAAGATWCGSGFEISESAQCRDTFVIPPFSGKPVANRTRLSTILLPVNAFPMPELDLGQWELIKKSRFTH